MSRATELADWLNQCIAASDDPEKVLACSAELRRLDRVNAELVEALKDAVCALEVCGKDYIYTLDQARAALTSSGDHA